MTMAKTSRRVAAACMLAFAAYTQPVSAQDARSFQASVTDEKSDLLATRHGIPFPKLVTYKGPAAAGEILVNIETRRLYFINGDGTAVEYWIAVGKNGSSPTGVSLVSRKIENPYWSPTPNMKRKNPRLTGVRGGDPKNPLGPRALYLGESFYRIHGTIYPNSIGHAESSGCFRMYNADVMDLYPRVQVGAKVTMIRAKVTPGIADAQTANLRLSPL